MPCRIAYVSDIHLELYENIEHLLVTKIDPIKAEFLILAGDIGSPEKPSLINSTLEQFLSYCSRKFKQVFYILGNHEYIGRG